VYDETWHGVITRTGWKNKNADFGNGWYNDHHFHYGYMIYASAALHHLDSSFFTGKRMELLSMLVQDIGHDGSSSDDSIGSFPNYRHKDWFAGHSWATGVANEIGFATGKDQESSSEAVNAYYALSLFHFVTKKSEADAELLSARVALALEIRAAQTYWQIPNPSPAASNTTTFDKNTMIYEPDFAEHYMVAVVSETKVSQKTWFGDDPLFVHGINWIPFTEITQKLLPRNYVNAVISESGIFDGYLNPDPEVANNAKPWLPFLYMYLGIVDVQQSERLLSSLSEYGDGNSKTNALYWTLLQETEPSPDCCKPWNEAHTDEYDDGSKNPNHAHLTQVSSLLWYFSTMCLIAQCWY